MKVLPRLYSLWSWLSYKSHTEAPLKGQLNPNYIEPYELAKSPNNYLKLHRKKIKDLLLASGAKEEKLTPEHIDVYSSTYAFFEGRKWKTERLPSVFASLINVGATSRDLELCFDIYEYLRTRQLDPYSKKLIGSFITSFFNMLKLKPSKEEWQFYKDVLEYYKLEKSIFNLSNAFIQLFKAKPQESQLKLCIDTVEIYKKTGRGLNNFIETFANLLKENATNEQLEIYCNAAVSSNRKSNNPNTLGNSFYRFVKAKPSDDIWQLYKETLSKYKGLGHSPDGITECFSYLTEVNPSPLIFETFKNALKFDLEKNSGLTMAVITDYCVRLSKLDPSPTILRNYNLAILNGHLKTHIDSVNLLRDTAVHAAISNLTRSTTKDATGYSVATTNDLIRNDSVPYTQYLDIHWTITNPQAQKVYDETLRVYRRAFNIHHGFSSLKCETQRPPTREPPLLARFSKDVARSTNYINAKDINLFPGRGIAISGLMPERVFVSDISAKKLGGDPFHKYKKAWPWVQDVFDDLPKVHFIFTRGFIAVSYIDSKDGNNKSDKYKLEDIGGKKIDYSYIVFNDHHHNYGCDVAFLVPTRILRQKLTGTLIPYEDYTGFSSKNKDVNEMGLTPKELILASKQIPANVLNLCWGSNIGGGLCNAYPPNSSPYHLWEIPLRGKETEDSYRHIHKSHILGGYKPVMTPELEAMMIPLRKAHQNVYTLTTKYQNLLDIFRLSHALWHKGETLGEKLETGEIDFDLALDRETVKYEQVLEEGKKDEISKNPASRRMLVEAYKLHSGHENGKTDRNDFPLLVLTNALDYWKLDSPFILDTYDMTLNINGEKIQLSQYSDGTGSEETDIWYIKVIPYLGDSIKDLRFYQRKELDK